MTNTLRVRRAERRLSQMALADLAGLHHNRLWRIENEHAEPTTAERERISSALQCDEAIVFPVAVDAVSA